MESADPIQNLDRIDIVGARNDGGVDLVIIASSRLDGSPRHQRLLQDKVENYISYINSSEFRQEFGVLRSDQICIKLVMSAHWDAPMPELAERINRWVKSEGAMFAIESRNQQS